ncbi:hypothetical protein EV214_103155 [Marinisporobacter balticus]|uniref:Uncharacterized protein n=1 Tax=Marinisporobacter balticus TaxID=2018667 RepID=A0A4R2KYX0_9FIRM|nr:hypothetical protein EV214_103155 [Marinisporobacter balticus]
MISVETLERLYGEAGLVAVCRDGKFVRFEKKLDK